MRTINNLLQASLKVDLPFLMENSMIETAPDYVEFQRSQLFAGIQSDGKDIQRIGAKYKGYAPATIKIKEKKGQPTDRVTLKDTGDFYFDAFADARPEGIVAGSADSKSQKLQGDYGEKIFGLADPSKQAYIDKLRPETAKQMTDQLNKR
jgi:hypothetical protein